MLFLKSNIEDSSLISLIACIFILFFAGCSKDKKIRPIEADSYGTITNIVSLNNASDNGPLISAVSLTTTDINDNIYLVDARTSKIHSYTSNLTHRWTAGGKGDGPGLFNMVSALYVSGNQLYVYENANSTMTPYTLSGERLREWTFGESGHPINNIRRMPGGKFIATGLNEKNGTMVNVYSDDFKNRVSRFITIDEIFTTKSPALERQVLRSYPGSVMPATDSTVVYAPAAYSGQLPIYRLNVAGNWVKAATVEGYKNIETPLFFSESSDGNNDRSLLSGMGPNGRYFHTEFNSMSRGLYQLNDGRTAHLSLWLNENDQWDLVIEYFDLNNFALEDHTIIKGLIPSQQLEQMPIWMDKNGKIYMSQRSDIPLRIIEISSK